MLQDHEIMSQDHLSLVTSISQLLFV